jgi:hypothetical protein
MTSHQRARWLLGASLLFGVAGERLLDVQGLGLNFTLLVLAWLAAWVSLARDAEAPAPLWILAPMALCAAGFAWRDDGALWFFDLVGLGLGVALLALPELRRGLALGSVPTEELVASALRSAAAPFAGAWPSLRQLLQPEPGAGARRKSGVISSAARGALLAVPVLFVIGGLLVSADARFENLVSRLIDFRIDDLVRHVMVSGFLAWVAAGLLWVTLRPLAAEGGGAIPIPSVLGPVEVATILGLLDLLFLAFVVVQGSYLFGGERLVESQPGLGYAEYARRGFFQLVIVGGLSVSVLLGVATVAREGTRSRGYRALAGLQVGLLFLILASACHRLLLYVARFGLTLDRLEASAVLLWVAVALLWLAATVLRHRPERFLSGGLVAAAVILAALHLANPTAVVVEYNLARARAGGMLDVPYLARLGPDGVPSLVASLPGLPEGDRVAATRILCERVPREDRPLAWNYGRARAAAARATVNATGCGASPD